MDVYVIPVASDRYELYCEPGDERAEGRAESTGWIADRLDSFRVRLSRIDQQQTTESGESGPETWPQRMKARATRWIAEKVAEQRLLWRIQRHSTAHAFYPVDLSEVQAAAILQALLQRDAERRRTWMIFHAVACLLATVLLGPFFLLIPGIANLPAFYFGFRLFSHYMGLRGARHALKDVAWTYEPCEPLLGLRRALGLPPVERARAVGEIASVVRLPHLSRFFRQTAD